jgi:DNA-binding transcriptional ArsR family regulator
MVEDYVEMDAVFHALAHGTRREIVGRLAERAMTVGELAEPLAMSLAGASKHIKVLARWPGSADRRLPMTTQQTVVRLQRNISAPPERVYRAWLEPELLQQWLAPGSTQVVRAEADERVGGTSTLYADAMPEVADRVESGWNTVLNKLTETMRRAKS